MLNFNEIVKQFEADRSSPMNRIDKNGRFYHVVQRASNRENIYDNETAKYRANLLARICTMYNSNNTVLCCNVQPHARYSNGGKVAIDSASYKRSELSCCTTPQEKEPTKIHQWQARVRGVSLLQSHSRHCSANGRSQICL